MANCIKVYDNASDLITELRRTLNISLSPKEYYGDGVTIKHNAPIKRNNLLFINALCAQKSTVERSHEEVQRLAEYEKFKIDIESVVGGLELHSENVEVDNYVDMKMEFKKYLKDTPQNYNPANITVVFLGHGYFDQVTGNAMLCFEHPEWPLVNEAFNELHDIHKDSEVKSRLKIVFSQCYSHKHNIKTQGNAKSGIFCEPSGSLCETKFMFLSSDAKQETSSLLRLTSQPKSACLLTIEKDRFVDNCLQLPQDVKSLLMLNHEKLAEYIETEFKVKLNEKQTKVLFETENVPQTMIKTSDYEIISRRIKEKIAQLKKEIKYYMHFKINPYSKKAASSMKENLSNDYHYPFDTFEVMSFDILKNLMMDFIEVSTQIPIIFISGYCRNENEINFEKYKMIFSGNEYKSIEDILKIVKSSPDDRVTFFCEDVAEDGDGAKSTTGHVSIYSESFEKLENAMHAELFDATDNIAKGFD